MLKFGGGVILETAQSPKSTFPFWIWGRDFGLGLGLRLVNNYSNNVYLFIDTNLIKNVKSILFMFLSTKVILNTRGTFLKKSSFLCTGCICLLPCDISRIRSTRPGVDKVKPKEWFKSPLWID